MTRPNNYRRRWLGVAAAAVPLVGLAPHSQGVTFYSTGDPNYNTTAPVGSLANTAWGYSGNWSAFTGTAIAPQYFITAAHVGGTVGDNFAYNGTNYQTIPFADGSPNKRIQTEDGEGNTVNTDLVVWKIAGTFSSFAGLWKTSIDGGEAAVGTAANPVVVVGRGTRRGAEVLLGGDLRGWEVGAQDSVRRWGTNVISGTTSSPVNIGTSWGNVIALNFDADPAVRPSANAAGYSGASEGIVTAGDSGGGIFIKNAAGKWKLAGVTWAVGNGYSYTANGTAINGPLFDVGGFYLGSTFQNDTAADKPVTGYGSQISSNFDAINGLLTESWAWNVDASGNWLTAANWWNAVMNTTAAATPSAPPSGGAGAGKEIVFGSVITAPRTVTLGVNRTAGNVLFDGPNAYMLSGASTLTLESANATDPLSTVSINVTSGNHTIATPVTLNKKTTVNVRQAGSTLTMTGTITAPGMTITKAGAGTLERPNFNGLNLVIATGTAKVSPGGATATAPGSLSITGGKLDLTDNDLVLDYTGGTIADTVRGWLASAYNGGAWNGATGITSSTAAATPNLVTGLAYAEASALLGLAGGATTTWSGQVVDATAVLVKYTYFGDANFDGTITNDDYALLDRGRALGLTGWINGDFNYDNVVDAADYALADRAFALKTASLSPSFLAMREAEFGSDYVSALLVSIPEPIATACLPAALPLLLRRRRRYS